MLVEQLGSDLKELKSLENADSIDEARTTLDRLLAAQEHERRRWRNKYPNRPVISSIFRLTTNG